MNSKIILSLSLISFLFLTGCAQRTTTPSTTGTNGVYDTSSGTVVYSDSNLYGNSTYGDKTTVITPTDTYTPVYVEPTTSNNSNRPYSTYGTTSSGSTNSTYGSSTTSTYGTGAYSYPSGTTYTYPSTTSTSTSSTTTRPYTPATTTTTSSSSSNATMANNCKGIHLQVASLASSSLAENYRKSLSLSGSQKSYVKSVDGKNKVIICGISSINEANTLKSTKFPGSFVVSGSATSSSSATTPSSSSTTSTSSSSSKSGVGIQIGAFSSKVAASNAIASYNGKYTSEIKEVKSNGKTLYKAILKGFKNEAEAKSAISSGKVTGFIVN
jgi:chitinase